MLTRGRLRLLGKMQRVMIAEFDEDRLFVQLSIDVPSYLSRVCVRVLPKHTLLLGFTEILEFSTHISVSIQNR